VLRAATLKRPSARLRRLRDAIRSEAVPGGETSLHVTCSIGSRAPGPGVRCVDSVVREADEALYRAKNRRRKPGRGRRREPSTRYPVATA